MSHVAKENEVPDYEKVRRATVKEYIKCAQSPEYFIMKYCMIVHQKRGMIPFHMYDFQKEVLDEIRRYRFNIILKSRQMGLSTLVSAYSLWLMLFNDHKNVCCISYRQDTAKNLVKKAKLMYDKLPVWLKEELTENNKTSFQFANGSRMWAESTGENAGRSESISFLILDEAAMIGNAQEIWGAAHFTLDVGKGHAIVISTPKGVGSWYHQTWVESVKGATLVDSTPDKEKWKGVGANNFHPIKIHWKLHPERDTAWREEQDQELGERIASRECDCNFETSGDTVVDMDVILWYQENTVQEPSNKHRVMGVESLWVWEDPDPKKEYVLASDVARGDSKDYSTFQIWEVRDPKLCAEFKMHIPPEEFGDVCAMYGGLYNNALIIIERNGYGRAALRRVVDRGYNNVFYSSNNLQDIDVMNKNLSYHAEKRKMKPGVDTNSKTRPEIISKLNEYLRNKEVKVRSNRYCEELKTFVWKTPTRAEHMDGYNDDLVMASMFYFWVRDTALAWNQKQKKVSEAALGAFGRGSQPKDPMGGFHGAKTRGHNPFQVNIGGQIEDISWLID